MKKRMAVVMCLGLAVAFAMTLGGCAGLMPMGGLYTKVVLPADATSSTAPAAKVGTAECTSILSLVATGDASIDAAAKAGGITKIHHVDWDAMNILGLYGKYTCIVYGD